VVQDQLMKWSTVIGLHVYIRLDDERRGSSHDGNAHARLPYPQRSRMGPRALSGLPYVGL